MTEEEWLKCDDPAPMLEYLRKKTKERKLRLFVACCCRSIWQAMKKKRSRTAVEAVERYAEGLADAEELEARQAAAYGVFEDEPDNTIEQIIAGIASDAALRDFREAANSAIQAADVIAHLAVYGWDNSTDPTDETQAAYHAKRATERTAQCRLLRDIFGNPFRPGTFNPAWRTSDAMLLAQGIYEDLAFDRMPILADALQDAGCGSEDILNHCRDTNATHVRGCWVVDLVLDKT